MTTRTARQSSLPEWYAGAIPLVAVGIVCIIAGGLVAAAVLLTGSAVVGALIAILTRRSQ